MDKMNTNVSDDFVHKSKEVLLKRIEERFGQNLRRLSVIMSLSKRRLHCGVYFGWKRFDVDGKCFQELHKHSPVHFDVKYIVMDPGYSKRIVRLLKGMPKAKYSN